MHIHKRVRIYTTTTKEVHKFYNIYYIYILDFTNHHGVVYLRLNCTTQIQMYTSSQHCIFVSAWVS